MKRSLGQWIGMAAIGLAGFSFVSAVIAISVAPTAPGGRDFIEYWAAEQQLVHHANPYDAGATLQLEQANGFHKNRPEFWYSPPADLILALPLGWLNARHGLLAWLIASFAALCLSIGLAWRLNGYPDTLIVLLGFAFAPALNCMQAGQISLFMLLGLMLFLTFWDSLPLVAGAALLPCTLKPHLFLPFALCVLLWAVYKRKFQLIAGLAAALALGCAVTFYFDSAAWSEYARMMRGEGMLNEFMPTVSGALRFLVDRNAVWIQFAPEVLACGWALWFFWTRRNRWNWMQEGMLVLMVSALCRPYGWFFDESVLLPALLTAALHSQRTGRSLVPLGLVATAALIESFYSPAILSAAYLWTTPAWFACYLYATRKKIAPRQELPGA